MHVEIVKAIEDAKPYYQALYPDAKDRNKAVHAAFAIGLAHEIDKLKAEVSKWEDIWAGYPTKADSKITELTDQLTASKAKAAALRNQVARLKTAVAEAFNLPVYAASVVNSDGTVVPRSPYGDGWNDYQKAAFDIVARVLHKEDWKSID